MRLKNLPMACNKFRSPRSSTGSSSRPSRSRYPQRHSLVVSIAKRNSLNDTPCFACRTPTPMYRSSISDCVIERLTVLLTGGAPILNRDAGCELLGQSRGQVQPHQMVSSSCPVPLTRTFNSGRTILNEVMASRNFLPEAPSSTMCMFWFEGISAIDVVVN